MKDTLQKHAILHKVTHNRHRQPPNITRLSHIFAFIKSSTASANPPHSPLHTTPLLRQILRRSLSTVIRPINLFKLSNSLDVRNQTGTSLPSRTGERIPQTHLQTNLFTYLLCVCSSAVLSYIYCAARYYISVVVAYGVVLCMISQYSAAIQNGRASGRRSCFWRRATENRCRRMKEGR